MSATVPLLWGKLHGAILPATALFVCDVFCVCCVLCVMCDTDHSEGVRILPDINSSRLATLVVYSDDSHSF